jgi:RNA polymerase sigma factor (sigma-70 family)
MSRVLKLRRVPGKMFERSTQGSEGNLSDLVESCRAGDPTAIRTLLTSLAPSMLQVIRRVLGPGHPDLEDTLQEAMLAATRALPTFRGECSARHFGCRIATFVAISSRRRQPPLTGEISEVADEAMADPPADAGTDWALAARRRELVRALLDQLPVPQAEALVLHCVGGLTVEELAAATSVPIETARSRLRLAKGALRLRIAGDAAAAELMEDFS